MFFRHSLDKLIYPVLALALLAAVSYRPKYRLRPDMPREFSRQATATSTKGKQTLDQKIAWAYWESARMDIQWRYPHGKTLPPDPPPEFHIVAQALGPAASDPSARQLYWERLQQVWYMPETWQKQYQWDWSWAGDPLTSAGQWLRGEADRLFSLH